MRCRELAPLQPFDIGFSFLPIKQLAPNVSMETGAHVRRRRSKIPRVHSGLSTSWANEGFMTSGDYRLLATIKLVRSRAYFHLAATRRVRHFSPHRKRCFFLIPDLAFASPSSLHEPPFTGERFRYRFEAGIIYIYIYIFLNSS